MPEILSSSNLDANKDQAIDTRELQSALDKNFFDKLSVSQKSQLEIELQQIDSMLEESFCKALTLAYLDANKRIGTRGNDIIAIAPQDQAIVDLYLKLSQNSNWKHYILTEVEQQKLQTQDYKERKEGKPYSTQWLEGKKREFMGHIIIRNGTHAQKALLLKTEVERVAQLKEPTLDQKHEWMNLLIESLMFNEQGKPSIFALKDRALGQRETNKQLISSYQQQIQTDLASLKKMYEDLGQSTAMLEFADPKVFLMKKQLHFAQLAEKDLEKIVQLPDNEKGGSFASGWNTMKWEEFLPFVGQANNWYKNSMIQKLSEWAEGGANINGGDLDRYALMYGDIAIAGQDSFLHAAQGFQALQQVDFGSRHNIGKGVGNALPFLGEMFYLGPIFRQVGFAVETISSANKGKQILMETANIISRGGVAAGLDVPRVGNMTSERMLDDYGATFDEKGNIRFEVIKEGEGFNEALAKAFGSLWVEMSVEHGLYKAINGAKLLGFKGAEALTGKAIPPQIIAEGLMSRWVKRFATEFPAAKTAQELLSSLTNKYGAAHVKKLFQRDGIITEYIEEEVSNRGTNIVTGDRGDRNPFYLSTQREVFETFMTTLIIGSGMKTISSTGQSLHTDNDLMQQESHNVQESVLKSKLDAVLSIKDVKPEGCSDQEFLDGVRPMGDYTNFTLMSPYIAFIRSGVEHPYTNEQEFIIQLQDHLKSNDRAMFTFEEYKKYNIDMHYAGKPVSERTQKMFDFADTYPAYIQNINTLVDVMKNGHFTTIEEYLKVYNQLARFVDASKWPNENNRYHITLEEALAMYNKGLQNSKENTVASTSNSISKTLSESSNTTITVESESSKYPDKSTYFEGKSTKFGFTEETVLRNNGFRENPNGRELVKKRIEFYAREYEIDEKLELTDAQLDMIWEAHVMPGELGNVTMPQLLSKLRALDEAFSNHPNKSDLGRLCLEAGFCGFKGFAVKSVLKIKAWKERRTPMNAVYALHAMVVFNTIDDAKSDVLHKLIDLGQNISTTLQDQATQIQTMGSDFEADINLRKDQYDDIVSNYDEMVTNYTNFLELAKEYNDTRAGKALNRWTDDKIDNTINAAESGKSVLEGGKMSLEETQQMVDQVNVFLNDLQVRTDASIKVAETFQHGLENAHFYTDMILNTIQVITGIILAFQIFYAYGLYHSKSSYPAEQKAMMNRFKFGIGTSIVTLLTYYAAINPMLQDWVGQVTSQIQQIMDSLDTIELTSPK